jgi:hypothetical protein
MTHAVKVMFKKFTKEEYKDFGKGIIDTVEKE